MDPTHITQGRHEKGRVGLGGKELQERAGIFDLHPYTMHERHVLDSQ